MSKETRIISAAQFLQVKGWARLTDAKLTGASSPKLEQFLAMLNELNDNSDAWFEFEQPEETPMDQRLLGSIYFRNLRKLIDRVQTELAGREFDALLKELV